MTAAVFVDTSVLLLTAGRSAAAAACAGALRTWQSGAVEMNIAAETVQEFVVHRTRVSDAERAIRETRTLVSASVVHALDVEVLDRGLDLMGVGLRGRDAMIAATALMAGFEEIVSADADFDSIPGLRRVDPRQA